MKRFYYLQTTLLLVALMFFAACSDKDYYIPEPTPDTNNPLGDVTAPGNFDWSTTTTINTNISVDDQFEGKYFYLIEVFDKNPLLEPTVSALAKGMAKKGVSVSSKIVVANGTEYIYIRQTDPKGRATVKQFSATGTINCLFSTKTVSADTRAIATRVDENNLPSYTQVPDNAIEVTGSSTNADWFDANKNYKISGSYSGGIYHSGRGPCKLYITGTWTVPASASNWASQIERNLEVIIMPGGKIICNNSILRFVGSSILTIMPGGVFDGRGLYFTNTGESFNLGDIALTGDFEFNAATDFYNNGTIIAKNIKFTNGCTLTNAGHISVENMTMTSSCNLKNYCLIEIANKLSCNSASASVVLDQGTIIAKDMEFNNTTINLNNGSMLKATNRIYNIYNNKFQNSGTTYSLVKSPTLSYGWNGGTYTGNIGIETTNCTDEKGNTLTSANLPNYQKTNDGAVNLYGYDESDITIVTKCGDTTNPENPGEEPEDPNDQIVVDPTTYSYLFEDQWPLYGDYDMNDVVLTITNRSYKLNKDNKAENLSFNFKVEAVGANKKIAGAVMLDKISASNIQKLEYSENKAPASFNINNVGIEAGQDYAVIPLFDDAHALLSRSQGFINTVKGDANNVSEPPVINVSLEFQTPVDPDDIIINLFNFFIITDIHDKGVKSDARKEIHIIGFKPSAKADTSLFGTEDDNSTPNKYYSSKNNLTWAFMIPNAFNWTIEKNDIQDVYSQFKDWVISAGAQYPSWWETYDSSKVF